MVTADVFDQRIIRDFSQSLSVPRCEEMWTVSSPIVSLTYFVGIYIHRQYIVNIMIVHVDNILMLVHIFTGIVVKWLGLVCSFQNHWILKTCFTFIQILVSNITSHVDLFLLRNRYILENKYEIILNVYLRYCLSVHWPK